MSSCPLYEWATLYFSLNCQRTLFGQAAKRPVFPVLELGLKINHSLRKQQAGVAIAVKSITARNGMRIDLLHSLPSHQCAYQHEQCGPGQVEIGHQAIDGPKAEDGRATSELQSLMRISYAAFCLKKKIPVHTHKKRQANMRDYHQ